MNSLIQNYVNGNLKTAKAQAVRFAAWRIREALIDELGYSLNKATLSDPTATQPTPRAP